MKRILLLMTALIALSFSAFGQSTRTFSASLSAACTNSTTTCDATANSQLKFSIGEYSLASITAAGTYSGITLNFEFSPDGGTTWFPSSCTRNEAAVQENNEAVPDNSNRSWDCGVAATSMFRIRLAAISSGSVTMTGALSSVQIEPAPTVSASLPTNAFYVVSNPAAGSQASASQAAAGALLKNVATMICFSAAATTAPALTAGTVNLRDGATGAGTIKATFQITVPATTGQSILPFCTAVNVVGSLNTAMTLEFSAGIANLIESVTLHGYTTP